MVATLASGAGFRSCTSKSRFLTGGSRGKLSGEMSPVSVRAPTSSSSVNSFKVVAKKGEWLPGLASPGYLTGR